MTGQVFASAELIGLHSPATNSFFADWASPAMRGIESALVDIGNSGIPVLLTGERGVGKKSMALRIHQLSSHRNGPVLRVRCSSLSSDEINALVLDDKEQEGGTAKPATLILDEVSELSPDSQNWLVQNAWNNGRTDGSRPRLRFISTTRFDLDEEKRGGRFSDDLYYRLSGVCLHLPPLRRRREDIPPLAQFFADRYAELFVQPVPSLSGDAMGLVVKGDWPGNVGELEAVIRRVVAAGDLKVLTSTLGAAAPAYSRAGNGGARSLKQVAKEASRQAERALILKVLTETRWNRKRAAERLQISYKALLYKLKQIGLEDPAL